MGAEVDTGREAVELLAKRVKSIDWRDGCLMERACATLRALLARAEAAETNVSKMRETAERLAEQFRSERDAAIAERDGLLAALREAHAALKMAREFGISSVGYHAMQSSVLAEWVDGGMQGDFPIYDSPFVKQYLESRAALGGAK